MDLGLAEYEDTTLNKTYLIVDNCEGGYADTEESQQKPNVQNHQITLQRLLQSRLNNRRRARNRSRTVQGDFQRDPGEMDEEKRTRQK